MSPSVKYLIAACVFLVLVGAASSINAAPHGFLEGQLKILARRPVDLADENVASKMAETHPEYSFYPLVISSRAERKQIAQVTADKNGNYRIALPPGDYILDVQRRESAHFRAKPQPFTVVANETVHVDMTIDTGSSAEAIAPQQ